MKYVKVFDRDGVRVKVRYRQELEDRIDSEKGKIRDDINKEVFDPEDSIADNAKMIFLLLSMIKRLYEADFNKDNLNAEDKGIIEYALDEYTNTETRMDLQFQEEGVGLIDKLLNRQKKIAEIIKEVKNG